MSAHRFRRVDRRTAERLLRGAPDPTRAGEPDALSDLLAAASATARDSELAGEQAAMAAFRAARLADAPQPRRQSMLKVTLAKLLTVKIAAAAVAAVTVGGVAVAAVTGNLPTQREDSPATSSTSTVASTDDQETKSPSAGSEGKPGGPDKNTAKNTATDQNNGDKPNGDKDNNGNGGNGSPSPSLVGLCHAYTAGAGADHGKALENPAFTFLITTAGGRDKVPAYCADLLAKEPKQSEHPTGKPTTHPNGPDGEHPGKANGTPPSTHPGH